MMHYKHVIFRIGNEFWLIFCRCGRKEERSRWDPQPHLPNTPQRMPPGYDGRDRSVMYNSNSESDRWNRER